jgi:tetratricopeptide (TPR) repeat protein
MHGRTRLWLGALILAPTMGFAQPASPTFTRDIAPIVFEHCAPCHRPEEIGPFSLLTFDDVRTRGRRIADVTARRAMPPWKPTREAGAFVGERGLTDRQINTIARWVERGMPEGNPAHLPALPPAATGWRLGTPDLVVTLPEPFVLGAEGDDVFRTFVIPIPITETRYVAGVEFRADAGKTVHHANLRLDATPASRELDGADPLPGYEGGLSATARFPEGYFLGWTPGQLPPLAPKGMAWRLSPGTDFVVQLHLRRSGKTERVQPSIGFHFTGDPPGDPPLAIRLGRQNLDIAAGARYVARDSYRLPVPVAVHAVHPHAHSRATDIQAYAEMPDGTRRWLLRIPDWDFNWQDVYRFAEPVELPAGATIAMEYTYDNSASNPRNPDRPPRRVIFGQNSSDEMGDLWLQVRTRTTGDRATLLNDIRPKTTAEDAAGYRMLLAAQPDNAGYHSDLALIYVRLGRVADAVRHFDESIRLNPASAPTFYNVATLLASNGRFEEAAARFRSAIQLRPNHGQSHNNLGVVLRALGRHAEAVGEFRRAVELDPGNAEARANLAAALKQ